jgi:hypothetical protein
VGSGTIERVLSSAPISSSRNAPPRGAVVPLDATLMPPNTTNFGVPPTLCATIVCLKRGSGEERASTFSHVDRPYTVPLRPGITLAHRHLFRSNTLPPGHDVRCSKQAVEVSGGKWGGGERRPHERSALLFERTPSERNDAAFPPRCSSHLDT